jgi:hypothetical protein
MRNEALETARERGYDYLMMQDADIYCPAHISPLMELLKALEMHDAAMAGAVCALRRMDANRITYNVEPYRPDGSVYEAEKLGTGMVLIDVKRVCSLDYDGPWFARLYADERQTKCAVGEDIFFCKVLRGLGQKIVVCSAIPTIHVHSNHVVLVHSTATRAGDSAVTTQESESDG